MSIPHPPGVFRPAQQGHTVATLILIENSAAMVERWPDLRDRHLPTLLGTMRMANPVVPVRCNAPTPSPLLSFLLSIPPFPNADSSSLDDQLPSFSVRRGHRSFQRLTAVQSTTRGPF